MALALLLGGPAAPARAGALSDTRVTVLSAGVLPRPPVLDGRIEAAEWRSSGATDLFHPLGSDLLLDEAPEARVGFDADCLYVAATLPLPEGARPKADARQRDGQVWADDALELFLDPRHDHRVSYQFLVNAANTQADLRDQDLGWNGAWRSAVQVGPRSWSVEIAIPWADLGIAAPADRTVLGLNLGWDRQTPAATPASWAPLSGSFHQPDRFGHLVCRRGGPVVSCLRRADAGAITFEVAPAGDGALPAPSVLSVTAGGRSIGERMASGTQTTLSVPLPKKEGRVEGGDYACTLVVSAGGDALPVARAAGTVHVQPPLALTVRKQLLSGKLFIEADAAGAGSAPAAFEAVVRAPGGKEFARQRQAGAAGARAAFTFNVARLPAGACAVSVTALDASGARLVSTDAAFTRSAAPAWLHSKAGVSAKVMPPWTPLQVQTAGGNTVVRPSGRDYVFTSLPLPAGITARGASLLAGPMRILARADGKPVVLRGSLRAVKAPDGSTVVLAGTAAGGPLRLASKVTVEYDGNARVDLRLTAARPLRLEQLVIEAPLKKTHARYLYHYPGSWGASANARALPPAGWRSKFVPYVWVGDEDRGFSLYTESDQYWQPADPAHAVEVVPAGDSVVVRFNIIGKPVDLAPANTHHAPRTTHHAPRTTHHEATSLSALPTSVLPLTLAFAATPVKQPDKDVWDYRFCHYGTYGLEKQMVTRSSSLTYSGARNLNPNAGTLEMWARVRFDPDAPITSFASRGSLNRDLFTITGGGTTLGFYWNIDDRGMRVYLRNGDKYPVVSGARSEWRQGEMHHLALSWGEELRAYVDGKLTVRAPWSGSVSGPADQVLLEFGGMAPGFDVDEIRTSDVQREPEVGQQPYGADAHTLLLDRLDRLAARGKKSVTTPEKGDAAEVAGALELADGKFGKALSLAAGKPMPMLDYLKGLGVRTIVFHEHWTEYENYTETTANQEQLKSLVKACHQRGIQLLLYFGYLMANTCPEWEPFHDEVIVKPLQGEYIREPAQKDYTVCYASAWQNFIADGIARLIEKYDIDGVYLDGTEAPWACTNRAHGCGYVRPDGSVAPTYGMFAAREMVRRIYNIVKSKKPDGQVNCHNSTIMTMPSLGWATSSWDGEQFGSIARGADVEKLLPLDAFRCEFMGRQWGVPAEFLCYERPYSTHEALSFTLLHDVLVRGAGAGLEEVSSLWKAMDAFGRKRSQFRPYWNNAGLARVSPANCYTTLYVRPGIGTMCVVSNLGKAPADVEVTLDLAKLKLPPSAKGTNALDGSPVPIANGTIRVSLDPFDYALVKVAPK